MKNLRVILIALVVLLGYSVSEATHLMGGEVTYTYLDNNGPAGKPFRFKVNVNLYINCSDPNSFVFQTGDPGPIVLGVFDASTNQILDSIFIEAIHPLPDADPDIQAGCNVPGLNNLCIKLNQYQSIVNLPASMNGYYLVHERCCRNGSILNLASAGQQSMSIFTEIPATIFQNSSPTFTASAIPVICAGDTTTIVNNAFDPDGDQLIYSLSQPYGGVLADINNVQPTASFSQCFDCFDSYYPPHPLLNYTNSSYSVSNPFGAGSYAYVNAATGLTKYYGTVPGNYVIAVDVYEYRKIGGIDSLIGTTRRDLQFIVASCPQNASPSVFIPNPSSIGAPIVNDIIYIEQGDSLQFNISGSDSDGDDVKITASGSIVDGSGGYSGPMATMTTTQGTGSVTSQFNWKTDCSLLGNYNFTIDVIDDGCPPKMTSNVYTVNVSPFEMASSISGNKNVCNLTPNQIYSVSPNSNSTLEWVAVNGSINGSNSGNSVDVTWGASGTSQLKVIETSQFGCKDSLTINIAVNNPDTLKASNDTSFCNGTPVMLSVQGTNSPVWTPNVNISSTTSVNPTVSPTSDQWYFVKSSSSCTLKDSVFVSVITSSAPNVDSMYLCPDALDTIEITPDPAYTYSWSPSTGLSDSSVLNSAIILSNPGTSDISKYYYLHSSDTNGCVFEDTMKVIVKAKPDVESINGAFSVCPLSQGMLYWLDADTYFSYDWSIEGGVITFPNRHNVQVNWGAASDSASIGLRVVDYFGCRSDTAKFPVTINQTIPSETPAGATPLCITNANNIPYNVTHYGGNATYNWYYSFNGVLYSGGSQAFPSNSNITVMNWDSVGTIKLWVKVNYPTTDTVVCLVESDTLDILVENQPEPNLVIAGDTLLCQGDGTDINYSVSGLPNSSFAWTVTGGNITNGNGSNSILVDWTNLGVNTITVKETSQYGCVGTLQLSTMNYNPVPSPSFVGPFSVCNGFLENVDHTVEGWTGSNFLWSASGFNVTHENGTESGIGTIDWTGIEDAIDPTIIITEFADNGCQGRIEIPITYYAESVEIENVSTQYNDPEVIDIDFNLNSMQGQGATLYRRLHQSFDPWTQIGLLDGVQTRYTDNSVLTGQNPYDYMLGFQNKCDQEVESPFHTSILLEAISDANSSALIWNQYLAWDSGVTNYEIWRNIDNQGWELYNSANADAESITFPNGDDGLSMCYRVAALKNDTNEVLSWSNEVCLDFPHPLMIFNAFSPNGDDKNETFYVENLEYYNVESIEIMNRWGNVVYQDTNYDNTWNGGDLPDGTYFYVLKILEFDEPFKGTVLLHR